MKFLFLYISLVYFENLIGFPVWGIVCCVWIVFMPVENSPQLSMKMYQSLQWMKWIKMFERCNSSSTIHFSTLCLVCSNYAAVGGSDTRWTSPPGNITITPTYGLTTSPPTCPACPYLSYFDCPKWIVNPKFSPLMLHNIFDI